MHSHSSPPWKEVFPGVRINRAKGSVAQSTICAGAQMLQLSRSVHAKLKLRCKYLNVTWTASHEQTAGSSVTTCSQELPEDERGSIANGLDN